MGMPKKIMVAQIISMIVLLVFAIMLFGAFGGFSDKVKCLLDELTKLQKLDLSDPYFKDFDSVINDPMVVEMIAMASEYLPLLSLAVILPSVLIAAIELVVVLLSMNFCKNTRCDEICAKCLIFILMGILILGIACYGAAGGAGIAIGLPVVQGQLTMVTDTCDVKIPEIKATIATNEVLLTAGYKQLNETIDTWGSTYPASVPVPQSLYDAQAQASAGVAKLDVAKVSVAGAEAFCVCIYEAFSILPSFTIPGFGCVVGCLLLLIFNLCDCCALGICGSGKKKVAPEGKAYDEGK